MMAHVLRSIENQQVFQTMGPSARSKWNEGLGGPELSKSRIRKGAGRLGSSTIDERYFAQLTAGGHHFDKGPDACPAGKATAIPLY